MSVIAARKYTDRIVMAADSINLFGQTKETKNLRVKLRKIGEDFMVGAAGTSRETGLFYNYLDTHKLAVPTEAAVLNLMVEFIDFARKFDERFWTENEYLIAYKTALFYVYDLDVIEVKEYAAIGAGEDYALTALRLGHGPFDAVKVACDLCAFTAGPIVVDSIKTGG